MITNFSLFIFESDKIHFKSEIKNFLFYDKEIIKIKFNSAVAELTKEQLDDGEMTIYISEIYDDIKGSGNAGLLMDKLMKFSDENNIPLSLRASVDNNIKTSKSNILSQEKLIKAYQRMGFRIAEELNRFKSDSTAPFMVYNYE
jgi:predicted GNAT family acetyltransferase